MKFMEKAPQMGIGVTLSRIHFRKGNPYVWVLQTLPFSTSQETKMIDPAHLLIGVVIGGIVSFVTLGAWRYRQTMAWRRSERLHEHQRHIEEGRILFERGFPTTAWPVNADYERRWYKENGYKIPEELRK